MQSQRTSYQNVYYKTSIERMVTVSRSESKYWLTELKGLPSKSIHRYRLLLTPKMAMRSLVSAFSKITPAAKRRNRQCVKDRTPQYHITQMNQLKKRGEHVLLYELLTAVLRTVPSNLISKQKLLRSVDVCRWTYLLGFPQLDPTSGDGFAAVSPRGNSWRRASKSASTVSLILSLLLTSILEQTGGFHCELLEAFRCSVVPKFGDRSYLKPPECHSCSHPLQKKKKKSNSPPKQMCGFTAAEGPLPPLSVYPDALGQTGLLFLVTFLDSSTLNIILRLFPNGPKSTASGFSLDCKQGALGN